MYQISMTRQNRISICINRDYTLKMGRPNKSLELTPGVPGKSDATIPDRGGGWAQVGGAAQLYVIPPLGYARLG